MLQRFFRGTDHRYLIRRLYSNFCLFVFIILWWNWISVKECNHTFTWCDYGRQVSFWMLMIMFLQQRRNPNVTELLCSSFFFLFQCPNMNPSFCIYVHEHYVVRICMYFLIIYNIFYIKRTNLYTCFISENSIYSFSELKYYKAV